MRLAIFTSDARRHRFVVNGLSVLADKTLVVAECAPAVASKGYSPSIQEHFHLRDLAEERFFPGTDLVDPSTLSMAMGEINSSKVYENIKKFQPTRTYHSNKQMRGLSGEIITGYLILFFTWDLQVQSNMLFSLYYFHYSLCQHTCCIYFFPTSI